jgi:hypothetical protein
MLPLSSKILASIAVALSFATVSWDGQREALQARRVLQTREIYDDCTARLEISSSPLSREGFASLVETLSGGELRGRYEELPLVCSSLFNVFACWNGRDCVGDQANISISTQEEQTVTCLTLASLLSESTM